MAVHCVAHSTGTAARLRASRVEEQAGHGGSCAAWARQVAQVEALSLVGGARWVAGRGSVGRHELFGASGLGSRQVQQQQQQQAGRQGCQLVRLGVGAFCRSSAFLR